MGEIVAEGECPDLRMGSVRPSTPAKHEGPCQPGMDQGKRTPPLLLDLLSASMKFFKVPRPKAAPLFILAVRGFSRFYCHFAFYAIEYHMNPNYRFSGLSWFARYLLGETKTEALIKSGYGLDTS